MKVVAAYLLAVLGGNSSPSPTADTINDILSSGSCIRSGSISVQFPGAIESEGRHRTEGYNRIPSGVLRWLSSKLVCPQSRFTSKGRK